jgi:BirA family biotin operon repressor/biotin-[acetyl-CoA-carboxylase] ligase
MYLRLAQWDRGRGFSAILADWLSAARGIGEAIRVRNGGSEKTGRFVGLDQSGRLVLEVAGGSLEKISAGDVFPFDLRGGRLVPSQQG